jgi:hypothetical protein
MAYLLDKYTEHGIGQLDDLRVMQSASLVVAGLARRDRRPLRIGRCAA